MRLAERMPQTATGFHGTIVDHFRRGFGSPDSRAPLVDVSECASSHRLDPFGSARNLSSCG